MSQRPRSPAPRSFTDMLFDPDEGPRLAPLLGEGLAPGQRAAAIERYAAWLVERGDPMGEWLTLAAALRGPEPPDAASLRARLAALGQALDPRWCALMSDRGWVLNCGEAADRPPPVRFAFECDRPWESFSPTDAPSVRHCDRCDQRVYACETEAEAEHHARQGRCISISHRLTQAITRRQSAQVTGRPHHPSRWASGLYGEEVHAPRR